MFVATVLLTRKDTPIGEMSGVFANSFTQSSQYHDIIKPKLIEVGFELQNCNHTLKLGEYDIYIREEEVSRYIAGSPEVRRFELGTPHILCQAILAVKPEKILAANITYTK